MRNKPIFGGRKNVKGLLTLADVMILHEIPLSHEI